MHSFVGVLLLFAQLSAPPAPEPDEHYQNDVAEAVKIHNSLDKEVSFQYQFEDNKWRKITIRPNSATYIWHKSPTQPLQLEYQDGRRSIRYQLQTSAVMLHRKPDRTFAPDFARHDEAQPYFFTSRNGGLSFYSGLDSGWMSVAAKSVVKTLRERQIDVGLLSGQFDMTAVDPIIFEAEWGAAEKIISLEYQKSLRTSEAPSIEHFWERSTANGKDCFTPRIVIRSCGTRFSAAFMQALIHQVTGQLPDTLPTVTECAATAFIRKGRLAPEFTKNGKLDLFRIQKSVAEDLAKNSILGVEREFSDSPTACRVVTQWQYVKTERFQYRWRTTLSIAISSNTGEEYGLDITTDITAQKQAISSNQWHNLTEVAVAQLGFLRESSLFVAGSDEIHSQPLKKEFEPTANVSKAMQVSRKIHQRVESILLTPSGAGSGSAPQ